MWEHRSWKWIDLYVRQRVRFRRRMLVREMKFAGRSIGSPKQLREQDWRTRVDLQKTAYRGERDRDEGRHRGTSRRVAAATEEQVDAFVVFLQEREKQYRIASRRYRLEGVSLEEAGFPRGMVPPGFHHPIEVILGDFVPPDDPHFHPGHREVELVREERGVTNAAAG
jgi:hypothetical protein